MIDEKNFYKDEKVLVTTKRIKIENTTYSLGNIVSVTKCKKPTLGCLPVMVWGLGNIISISSFILIFTDTIAITTFVVVLFIGLAFIVFGTAGNRLRKTDFFVRIQYTSRKYDALTSISEVYIDKIMSAIKDAIVDYMIQFHPEYSPEDIKTWMQIATTSRGSRLSEVKGLLSTEKIQIRQQDS